MNPQPELAIVTVVTRNYLHFARALAVSVKEVHPEVTTYIYLIDRPDPPYNPDDEPAKIIFAEDVGVPDWKRFSFQYDGFELCCALKPHVIKHVMATSHAKWVIYFDTDIQLYSRLDDLLTAARSSHIILIPHLTAPSREQAARLSEQNVLRHGTYNAGCVGVCNSDQGHRFLDWWANWVTNNCIADLTAGLFVDQLPLSLVPALFSGTHIERSDGYNVGYWNLPQRPLLIGSDGKPRIHDELVTFFHFSGFDPDEPTVLSKWGTPLPPDVASSTLELTQKYAERVDSLGRSQCRSWGYGLATLSDGTPINKFWREAVRTAHLDLIAIDDPFDAGKNPGLRARLASAGATVEARVDWRGDLLMQLEKRTTSMEVALERITSKINTISQLPGVRLSARIFQFFNRLR